MQWVADSENFETLVTCCLSQRSIKYQRPGAQIYEWESSWPALMGADQVWTSGGEGPQEVGQLAPPLIGGGGLRMGPVRGRGHELLGVPFGAPIGLVGHCSTCHSDWSFQPFHCSGCYIYIQMLPSHLHYFLVYLRSDIFLLIPSETPSQILVLLPSSFSILFLK